MVESFAINTVKMRQYFNQGFTKKIELELYNRGVISSMRKIALITGASRGIGKEIAVVLASKGIDIIINDLESTRSLAYAAIQELNSLGVDAYFEACDVADYLSVQAMFISIKQKHQKIDIIVNNAGIRSDKLLMNMKPEEWYTVIDVNLNSVYNITRNALELIPEGGRIINVSSIIGMGGNIEQTNYAASKAGMIGFTKSLSKELATKKITVNAVAPGFIYTQLTDNIPPHIKRQINEAIPMKEMGQPHDVAYAIAFFASDEAKYITGQVLRVDGGLQM